MQKLSLRIKLFLRLPDVWAKKWSKLTIGGGQAALDLRCQRAIVVAIVMDGLDAYYPVDCVKINVFEVGAQQIAKKKWRLTNHQGFTGFFKSIQLPPKTVLLTEMRRLHAPTGGYRCAFDCRQWSYCVILLRLILEWTKKMANTPIKRDITSNHVITHFNGNTTGSVHNVRLLLHRHVAESDQFRRLLRRDGLVFGRFCPANIDSTHYPLEAALFSLI